MGSTYLQLTNKLLRRLNEVELDETNFNTARGLQATVKDAINDSISVIQARVPQLSYMAYEHTQDLSEYVNEYAWPDEFLSVDWKSFQIVNDGTLNTETISLEYIKREQWYQHHKSEDDDKIKNQSGGGKPIRVFETHGTGFGISPPPDEAYEIKFRYWKNPTYLTAHGDITNIPTRFDYVILAGALFHMYRFRDNDNRTAMSLKEFERGLIDMKRTLIEKPLYMSDTRVGIKDNGE